MRDTDLIEAKLSAAFAPIRVEGVVTPHECEECAAIRHRLQGQTWLTVNDEFAEEFSGSLPLLSSLAYIAYLPIWLRAAVHDPNGDAASMVLINLADDPPMEHFTRAQAEVILEVANFVAASNQWGAEDPANMEGLRRVERTWGAKAA